MFNINHIALDEVLLFSSVTFLEVVAHIIGSFFVNTIPNDLVVVDTLKLFRLPNILALVILVIPVSLSLLLI